MNLYYNYAEQENETKERIEWEVVNLQERATSVDLSHFKSAAMKKKQLN